MITPPPNCNHAATLFGLLLLKSIFRAPRLITSLTSIKTTKQTLEFERVLFSARFLVFWPSGGIHHTLRNTSTQRAGVVPHQFLHAISSNTVVSSSTSQLKTAFSLPSSHFSQKKVIIIINKITSHQANHRL